MTTRSEIKRWARPFLAQRQDLVLERDLLLKTPVRHVIRGVNFWRRRSADFPDVGWFIEPLFNTCYPSLGLRLHSEIPVGSSLRDDFLEVMEARVGWAIENYVGPIDTIQKLRDYATVPRRPHEGGFSALTLDGYPLEYAPVLAALGRLDEAQLILRPALEKDEQYIQAALARGHALLANRSNSASGKKDVAFANYYMPIHAELRRLLALLDTEDRAGIAGMLHEWERQNVVKWGIEHLWEPTPFPLEAGAKG